jgi:GntR family transcriptional regulator/MocR family aminotransferase
MAREYLLTLDVTTGDEPLYVAISRAIVDDIARQRLKPGERLPGSRKLAQMLGVNRNTVHAALADLAAQGWVEAQPARGVFVRSPESIGTRSFSHSVSARSEVPVKLGFELRAGPSAPVGGAHREGPLMLTGGVPDPRLFPRELLARAYRRVLARRGDRLLDYGDARGEPSLRAGLADMLTRLRALAVSADDVIITRGAQQAIWLVAHSLVTPGDRVGVERWGYPPAWEALRSAGAELVPLDVDEDGVRMESLELALQSGPLRAVYLTPHHQYPTMVGLDARRRLRLLELARLHRFAILEDDYTHEFQFEGRPRMPLASADRQGSVVYIGTLSKVLAPGLRIGYAVAPRALIERMAALRTPIDRQGDSVAEAAIAELIDEGELERHARRMRLIYGARRELLASELTRRLGERVSFTLPQGGMALWIGVRGTSPSAWVERAKKRGVLFRAGRTLSLGGRSEEPFVRMGFTRLNEAELSKAVKVAASVF